MPFARVYEARARACAPCGVARGAVLGFVFEVLGLPPPALAAEERDKKRPADDAGAADANNDPHCAGWREGRGMCVRGNLADSRMPERGGGATQGRRAAAEASHR